MEGSLVAYKVFTNGSVLQASEVNENLMQQAVATFSNAAARTAAITSPVPGQVTYLEDSKLFQTFDGTNWVTTGNAGQSSYNLVTTLYYNSSGTFTKATYPYLRAIRVKVQGAGGGSGGCSTTSASQISMGASGGGGAYAESFITDIASLSASETVTVGAGGAGGAAGNNAGSAGGTSSFGSLVSADGGAGGAGQAAVTGVQVNPGGAGSTTGTGELVIPGSSADTSFSLTSGLPFTGGSGAGFLGSKSNTQATFNNFSAVTGTRGSGSRGPVSGFSKTQAAGGAGGSGIVIVELYA
jgi:hypothetical protein